MVRGAEHPGVAQSPGDGAVEAADADAEAAGAGCGVGALCRCGEGLRAPALAVAVQPGRTPRPRGRDHRHVRCLTCAKRWKSPARQALAQEPPGRCQEKRASSDGTARHDRGTKLLLYRPIESLQDVLLIDPKTRTVEHHQRGARGAWKKAVRKSRAQLNVLGGQLAVADLFEGI